MMKADPGGGFVLKNARYSGTPAADKPGSPGAAGTAQSQAPGRTGRDIRLSAGPNVKLSEHLGHQVSVTGTMTGGMDPTAAAGRPDRPVSSTDKPSSTPDQPLQEDTARGATTGHHGATLTVTSLSMVSSTCSPAS